YDADKVKEKFGVSPAQIPALKALAGDASDNIPGAPGIGPKAAVEILSKCGTLERAFAEIETAPDGFCFGAGKRPENLKNILLRHKKQILDFQKLASMMADAPLGAVLEKCDFKNFSAVRARAALLERGLAGIAGRLPAAGAGVNRTLF
ncbi:MAG: 5'-3' exonuclease H3TH domain-containing protein, partial [Candidatus Bipolaricaulis sp.]|nr:5'-3' exonuclease H3TH domain-containing protein [Candidatus Bipolaricaulis sp.]